MRIVSLLPGATEIAFALGLGESIVAVSHECDFPEEARARPSITRAILEHGLSPSAIDRAVNEAVEAGRALYSLDAARLRELRPDLILTQGVCSVCAVSEDTVARTLRLLPDCLPMGAVTLSLEGKTVAGVWDDIRKVAQAAGVEERGETLVGELGARWRRLEAAHRKERPRVMMLEWSDPPFCGGHWVPEQVAAAGGEAVMGRAGEDSRRCSWEEVARADPNIVVVMACGYGLEDNVRQAQGLLNHPEASRLRALREGRLWAADANSYFSRPAPRLVRGAEILSAVFRDDPSSLDEGEALRVPL